MQFNPADKSISLIGDIDFWLFGSSETLNADYSLIDRTRNINKVYDEAVSIMFGADPNHEWDDTTNTDLPFTTLALEANQDHYTMLDTALVINRVRMKDSNGEMQTLTPTLRRELSDSELKATGTPTKYFKKGGVIFPRPIPDYGATAGVELEFQRGGNHFTIGDISESPGFNPQFHQFLSVGAALMYAIANGMTEKKAELHAEKTAIADAMRKHYERRSPDERPRLRLAKRSSKRTGL